MNMNWQLPYQPQTPNYYNYNGQSYAYNSPSPFNASGSSGYCSEASPTAYQLSYSPQPQPHHSQQVTTTSWYPMSQHTLQQTYQTNEAQQIEEETSTAPSEIKCTKRKHDSKKKNESKKRTKNEVAENFEDLDEYNLDGEDVCELGDNLNGSLGSSIGGDGKKKRVLNKAQRMAANVRERRRMNVMNESFLALRQALPIATGRKRRKMSRLDVVMGALEYIGYLDRLLKSDSEGPIEINFDAYQDNLYSY